MRIVVSGTHASGKSTLISDFHAAHPEYLVLGDPFDDLESETDDATGESSFAGQLRISATRLHEHADQAHLLAERSPLDFAAYLIALEALGRSSGALIPRAVQIAADALSSIDLAVLVPLDARHPIHVPSDEDPELREAMDLALLELADDIEHDVASRFLIVAGERATRLRSVQEAVRR
ncbi:MULTISPECIES: AAA family ATPase [unclassified Microbacterium]|uniref:AAA family ATPase n=1 Tax=unclassified Microbacterium TaxID=2609290 RepID=UPI001604F141|nr:MULTISPECIES: AAA family ATPase [unclassified Microbacterium]QNA93177.1 AAA family ATPase [Microbacterium sp. Se63.02b]QYM63381.1 ATP-binding protein [Microbacterium sp. Se5.02b]